MDAFIGEIRAVGFNYVPEGWASCNGQLLAINQYSALYSLLGTAFGGDGRNTFGLPNLQAVTPLGAGQGPGLSYRVVGETGGATNVTLTLAEIPVHTHLAEANNTAGGQTSPVGNYFGSVPGGGREGGVKAYASALGAPPAVLSPAALGVTGESLPHNNLSPYLALNYIIALEGVYPPRT